MSYAELLAYALLLWVATQPVLFGVWVVMLLTYGR